MKVVMIPGLEAALAAFAAEARKGVEDEVAALKSQTAALELRVKALEQKE